jgi:hypothetical protein
MGLGGKIEAVHFGSSPIEPAPLDDNGKPFGGPANRRAEMWLNMKKRLEGAESIAASSPGTWLVISFPLRASVDMKLAIITAA